jgi:hypothetical protein
MYVSVHTVAFHLRHIFRKLSIRSRLELARLAIERANAPTSGLISLIRELARRTDECAEKVMWRGWRGRRC